MTRVDPVALPASPPAEEIWRLRSGRHRFPHRVLGPHVVDGRPVLRVFRPDADAVTAELPGGELVELAAAGDGLFCAVLPRPSPRYRLRLRRGDGDRVVEDGYRFPPGIDAGQRRRLATGGGLRVWQVLGAHERRYDGVPGVQFAVWAPNALGVRVRGDFDDWDGRPYPLRLLPDCGVWELFVPGVTSGARYRFEVLGADGRWQERSDPLAAAAERPPRNASVVHTSQHLWGDDDWLRRRERWDAGASPLSVYEVHLGSWLRAVDGGWADYRATAHALAEHVAALGFTHVQLLPVAEHPFSGSWGYQVTSYFAPTARFGDPDGLRYLVDHLHRCGIGVLVDVVPAHFPRDEWALARFDGGPLYEHPDPRRGEHPDWGTLVFDLGRPQVRDFLISAALVWIEEFHADGVRVDAVSSLLYLDYSRGEGQWLPNVDGGRENLEAIALLRELTAVVHAEHPGVLVIAEESTAWPGVTDVNGLGFDLKWNMGWMHDVLEHLGRPPDERPADRDRLALSFGYAWSERFLLPLSHDEVVHGKGSLWGRMPGRSDAERAAGVRLLLAHMWAHPGKQLLFMGGEFGQPAEWDADGSPPWHLVDEVHGSAHHLGILRLVARLNRLHRRIRALHALDHSPAGFRWVRSDDDGLLAFLRLGDDGSVVACVANFSGRDRRDRVGLPASGAWSVLLDTADLDRGGEVRATAREADDLPASVELEIGASSAVWLHGPTSTGRPDLSEYTL